MPSQQIPVVGGVTSRRHAKLLHHLFENNGGGNGGAPVKDLRLRRVVPPASVPPHDSSPDTPPAAAKPVSAVQIQAQSTPPEPSAAAPDERKPMLPRSKLVRDPGSFGYRRLLPFLNKMAAKNNGSDVSVCKDTPSETKVSVSTNKELIRSDSAPADESVDGSQGGAAPAAADPVEPLPVVAAGDREVKDCSDDTVREEAKMSVSADPASSRPGLARCVRSKFVHHPSSFTYKRMLPFLDISSQEEDRTKIRRVSEEEQITSDNSDVLPSGHSLLAISKGSSEEGNEAEVDRVVDVVPSVSTEVQEATHGEVLASVGDPLSSVKGELTSDRNAVPAGGQRQSTVSKDSPEERDVAEVETTVEERKASQTEEKSLAVGHVELLVAKAGGDQEMKDLCDSVKEQTNIVPGALTNNHPCLTRSTGSRLVPQRNSFSYKRMLPFLMENGISSQEGDRAKFQRVQEEKQLELEETPVMATGHHDLAISNDSAEASYRAEVERIVEELASAPHENYLLKGGQPQSSVAEVSPSDGSTAEAQKVTPEVVLSSDKDELASDGDGVLAGAQCQLAVSEDLPNESNGTEAEGMVVEEKAAKSDDISVLDDRNLLSAVSEVSPQKCDTEKEVTHKPVLPSDGDEASRLTLDKAELVVKDQPQLCDSKKLLKDKAEVAEVQQCQSSVSGCPDTKRATVDGGADQQGAQQRHYSVASPDGLLLDVGTICKPSYPCLEKQCLSPKKLFPVNGALSGVSCLKKRFLSPKKGILKRHTNGCKGICMCLDCSVFRLRADRAFDFSRKQMQEADDIIGNLLEQVTSLRSLAEKSSGQQEQIEEACERASRVEEVARERRRQMQLELNAHCKIPGPRVKFAQYVEEKMASSPRSSRRQPPL